MLSKFFLRAAFSAAALTVPAGSASAEQYHILMMDHAFFPEISYVQPGDVVVFENLSGITRVINGKGNSWSTPEIADGGQASIVIEEGMTSTFLTRIDGVGGMGINSNSTGGGDDVSDQVVGDEVAGTDAEEGTIVGQLDFNAPEQSETN